MVKQDVQLSSPGRSSERGLDLFQVPTGQRYADQNLRVQANVRDLLFFRTRSHQDLTYRDGGD